MVVLPDPQGSKTSDEFRDANTVICARSIEAKYRPGFVVSEIAQESNIKFLVATQHMKDASQEENPMNKRKFYQGLSHEIIFPDYHFNSYFASGKVFTCSTLDSLMCQQFYNGVYFLKLIQMMVIGDRPSNLLSSSVFQISIPEDFSGKSYKDLLQFLLKRSMMPIGLYRSEQVWGTVSPYVYTNPKPNVLLHAKDRVFVLADHDPSTDITVDVATNNSAPSMEKPSKQEI